MIRTCITFYTLVVLLAVENAQYRKEQVDNIQVQADSSSDLLFHVMMAQDQLGIDQDVPAEDQSSQSTVDQLAGAAVGEEHGHKTEQQQAPQGAEQVRHPTGEVIFRLAGEGRQEDEDTGR